MTSSRSIGNPISPQSAAAILTWTIVFLGISIFFKVLILNALYENGIHVVTDVLFEAHDELVSMFLFPMIFAWDFFECLVIVFGLFLFNRYLFRINFNVLMLFAVLLFVVVVGANYLSFRELNSAITLNKLGIALAWTAANSDALNPYLRTSTLVVVAIVILWSVYPYLFSRYLKARDIGTKHASWFLVGLVWSTPLVIFSGHLYLTHWHFMHQWWWSLALVIAIVFIGVNLIDEGQFNFPKFHARRGIVSTITLVTLVVFALVYALGGLAIFPKAPFFVRGHGAIIATSLLLQEDESNVGSAAPPTLQSLVSQYQSLVFPAGISPPNGPNTYSIIDQPGPRHIVIVSLETAMRKYYPIIDNPDFPTFQRMSRNAIVSNQHHTAAPITKKAAFAILTGLYEVRGISEEGFVMDSLPDVLRRIGYDSTYIDSYKVDWHGWRGEINVAESSRRWVLTT